MPRLQLRSQDARIAYLATVYHLGRPGSELHPETLQEHEQGLRNIHATLQAALERAVADFDVTPYQLHRLDEALAGLANELKQYGISNGRSAVPGFSGELERLYPETRDEPSAAMDIAGHVVMLRRRIEGSVREADRAMQEEIEAAQREQEQRRRRWWEIWKS